MPYYFGGCRKSQWRQIKHRTVTEEPLVDVVQFIMISISTFRVWPGGAPERARRRRRSRQLELLWRCQPQEEHVFVYLVEEMQPVE